MKQPLFYLKTYLSALMLLFLAYGCTDDDAESPGTGMIYNPDKSTFSIGEAKELYDSYIGQNPNISISHAKSGDYSVFDMVPLWNDGLLSADSLWTAVEIPIDKGRKQGYLMTEEVLEYVLANNLKLEGMDYKRLVVLEDKQTGLHYAFVMVISPSLDYLKKQGSLEEITYLKEKDDFSGQISYFDTDGNLVNGWITMREK